MEGPLIARRRGGAGEGVDEAEVGGRALHRDVLDAGRLTAGDLGRLEDVLIELIQDPERVGAVAEAAIVSSSTTSSTHIQK